MNEKTHKLFCSQQDKFVTHLEPAARPPSSSLQDSSLASSSPSSGVAVAVWPRLPSFLPSLTLFLLPSVGGLDSGWWTLGEKRR